MPGATLGLLGGGQLGRMFAAVARARGYEVLVLDPDPESPAAGLATGHLCAPWDDAAALAELGRRCAAVTLEFENVPASALETLARHSLVRPGAEAVATCQSRIDEKTFLARHGFPTVAWAPVRTAMDLPAAGERIALPGLLKRDRFGYDGKGQRAIEGAADLEAAFRDLGGAACVLEQRLDLAMELSVVLARGADGETAPFPVAQNIHRDGILDTTLVPAPVPRPLADAATRMAADIASALGHVGVLGVEFFVDAAGSLLVNELAPRPHNSGHFTLDACLLSQFEQQLRSLCGLPLGRPDCTRAAAMVNILGDAWAGGEPRWEAVLAEPAARLHLYGKREPRPGRKMGHYTCLAEDVGQARELAERLRAALVPPVSRSPR